nr:hypothetical protein CFP56_71451 [Quercus suber]
MAYYNSNGSNGRRYDEDERVMETYTSTDYDRGYGGDYSRGPRQDERFTETETSTYYGGGNNNNNNSGPPPPPQLPHPWRAQWDDRERRYLYIHTETGERTWDFPGRGGYGGGGMGGYEQQSTTCVEEDERGERRGGGGGGHGLAYGALGALAGLAGGAFLMHEGHEMKEGFEQDKDRVEQNVEDFPEDAAEWTGRKVGEVEDIPQDVEQGFDRFGNRVEQGWDNTVNDVEDAPENIAEWVGEKVGGVERFGDNLDNAYDEGKAEGRDDDRW